MKTNVNNTTEPQHDAKLPVMRSLPADDIDTAIRMLKVHAYSQEEMEEIGDDMTKIDDAFAFDHAVIIQLLGGALDRNDA